MTTPSAPAIRVFEPALCCNTGVCGPDVDQALVTFTADLDHLRGLGVDIQRHNLANDPAAFTAEPAVRDFLRVAGSAGLPLTLVDGITVATGAYPTRDRLLSLAHRAEDAEETSVAAQALPTPTTARVDLGLTAVTSSTPTSSTSTSSASTSRTSTASGGCCGGGASGGSGCC